MKLSVRTYRSPHHGRVIHVLCDEHGAPLPNQSDIVISHDGDGSAVTVKFIVDEKRVFVSDEPVSGDQL